MILKEKIVGTVAVITVRGCIISDPDVIPFKTKIQDLAKCSISQIVVDLSHVKWFGAAMLGALVNGLSTTQQAGGDLRLAGITERIYQILMVTQLAGIFQTAPTVAHAVGSFYQPPMNIPQTTITPKRSQKTDMEYRKSNTPYIKKECPHIHPYIYTAERDTLKVSV